MRVIVGSDQVGNPLKRVVLDYFSSRGDTPLDAGGLSAETAIDELEIATRVGLAVASGEFQRGVLIGATGQGMSMAANKVPGIRAAVCHDVQTARLSRACHDANVLCLGAWMLSPQQLTPILDDWLSTDFQTTSLTTPPEALEQHAAARRGDTHGEFARLDPLPFRLGVALSPRPTAFGPLLFTGRLEEGMRLAARKGMEAVELSLRSASDVQADELLALLQETGLVVSAIATGQACIEDAICLCDDDRERQAIAIHHLEAIIRLASRLQAAVIIGGIRGRLTGAEQEQDRQREAAVETIRAAADYAAQLGVDVLLEPINRYETNFVNTLAEGARLIEQIGLPSLKLLADTFHMNIEEVNIQHALQGAGQHLGYVHLADNNRLAPGQGHIDFSQVISTLSRIGYRGYLVAEILPLPDDQTALHQATRMMHSLLERPAPSVTFDEAAQSPSQLRLRPA